jgi:hypothetical protein
MPSAAAGGRTPAAALPTAPPGQQGMLGIEQGWACKLHWRGRTAATKWSSSSSSSSSYAVEAEEEKATGASASSASQATGDDDDDDDSLVTSSTPSRRVGGRTRLLDQHSWCYQRVGSGRYALLGEPADLPPQQPQPDVGPRSAAPAAAEASASASAGVRGEEGRGAGAGGGDRIAPGMHRTSVICTWRAPTGGSGGGGDASRVVAVCAYADSTGAATAAAYTGLEADEGLVVLALDVTADERQGHYNLPDAAAVRAGRARARAIAKQARIPLPPSDDDDGDDGAAAMSVA